MFSKKEKPKEYDRGAANYFPDPFEFPMISGKIVFYYEYAEFYGHMNHVSFQYADTVKLEKARSLGFVNNAFRVTLNSGKRYKFGVNFRQHFLDFLCKQTGLSVTE